jgi:hypothetical protein
MFFFKFYSVGKETEVHSWEQGSKGMETFGLKFTKTALMGERGQEILFRSRNNKNALMCLARKTRLLLCAQLQETICTQYESGNSF